ncbi:MAG: hypothetical protein KJ066_03115 [Acidobacteria bacterium]|nr:hypothetical protein [Acidobacteriota bacterium]
MSGLRDLLGAYVKLQPDDAAAGLTALPADEAAAVLGELEPQAAADLLRRMSSAVAARSLAALPSAAAERIGLEMPVEILASLVRRFGGQAGAWLDALDPRVAEPVRRLLAYPDDTAGAVMDPGVVALQAGWPAGEARTQLPPGPCGIDHAYAVDPSHALVGRVDLATLLNADARVPLSSMVRPDIDWVRVEMPLAVVEAHPAWRQHDVMPVIDAGHRLVGVIRHRRLRQLDRDRATTSGDERAVRTLVALGEVYWLGLSGLLQGLAAAANSASADRREGAES